MRAKDIEKYCISEATKIMERCQDLQGEALAHEQGKVTAFLHIAAMIQAGDDDDGK